MAKKKKARVEMRPVLIRMPVTLAEDLSDLAKKERLTRNAYILNVLEAAVVLWPSVEAAEKSLFESIDDKFEARLEKALEGVFERALQREQLRARVSNIVGAKRRSR